MSKKRPGQTAQWAKSNSVTYVGAFLNNETFAQIEALKKEYARPKTWVIQRVVARGLAFPSPEGLKP